MPYITAKPAFSSAAALVSVTAAVGLLMAASGCTSSHKPGGGVSASAAASAAALADLEHQAQLASTKSFTATYRAEGSNPPSTGTIQVFRTSGKTRLDIQASGTTERVLVEPTGTFLCKLSKSPSPPCVTLAGSGQPLPSALDLQLQIRHLFTTAPEAMAKGTGFEVRAAAATSTPSSPPGSSRPGSSRSGPSAADSTGLAGLGPTSCFVIVSAPASSGVAPGTYCFSDGILLSVRFRTGSLTLTKRGPAPKSSDFTLPASPVPLTPSASPH